MALLSLTLKRDSTDVDFRRFKISDFFDVTNLDSDARFSLSDDGLTYTLSGLDGFVPDDRMVEVLVLATVSNPGEGWTLTFEIKAGTQTAPFGPIKANDPGTGNADHHKKHPLKVAQPAAAAVAAVASSKVPNLSALSRAEWKTAVAKLSAGEWKRMREAVRRINRSN